MSEFWLNRPSALGCSAQLVPLSGMPLNEQLNALTRLVLLIFLLLLLLDIKHGPIFLVIALGMIVAIYYLTTKKAMSTKENYTPMRSVRPPPMQNVRGVEVPTYNLNNLAPRQFKRVGNQVVEENIIETPQTIPFCNDDVHIDPPAPMAVSLNQQLTGRGDLEASADPKTMIKPIVIAPTHDLTYWRDNNLIVHSAINSAGIQKDMYLSGYAESTCCDYLPEGSSLQPDGDNGTSLSDLPVVEPYHQYGPGQIISPRPTQDVPFIPSVSGVPPSGMNGVSQPRMGSWPAAPRGTRENFCTKQARPRSVNQPRSGCRENYSPGQIVSPRPSQDIPFIPVVENYEQPQEVNVRANQPGWVNTACGYNAEQVYQSGLPSNLPAGNCQQNPEMKRYNENMFTSIVTPGVYTRTEVNEPINSNIGISFQQQFEPVTCYRNDNGLHYVQNDPRIIEPNVSVPEPSQEPRYDNVYDPRFYGYGTSYRSYNEPVTGQTRFMYDDVNAIRMPNYVVRSKIDHLPFADSYGPMQPGSEMGNVHNPHIRQLAQDSWLRNSLQFRNDMTERLMRKRNAEAWQQRQAPLGARQIGSYRKQ